MTLTGEDSSQLIRRAQAGETDAFEVLVSKHRRQLLSATRSRLRDFHISAVEAEEIVQETFTRALASLDKFEWQGDAAFGRWLAGIARRVLLTASRKAHRHVEIEAAGEPPLDDPTPSQSMRRSERFDRLEQSLRNLSNEHREVILLSRVDGLTTAEIAERMGRTPGAVKQLLFRALRKLRQGFGETESLNLPDRRLDPDGLVDREPPR